MERDTSVGIQSTSISYEMQNHYIFRRSRIWILIDIRFMWAGLKATYNEQSVTAEN